MDTFERQIEWATKRYEKNTKHRERRLINLKGGDWRKVEEPRRILRRLNSRGLEDVVSEAMADTDVDAAGAPTVNVLERILDTSELRGVSLVYGFAAFTRAVARIEVRLPTGGLLWRGTGFLISPRLLMTNNHVIASQDLANGSIIQFDYYRMANGQVNTPVEFSLSPERFFITDQRLDFTIVAVKEENSERRSTKEFGFTKLIRESGKAVVGERVNIIQHPSGRPKEIALRENTIVDVPEDFLHYTTDTQEGSSGSPVLNDDGELAALHHAGVPKRDSADRILLRDGRHWDGSRATHDEIAWIANEGVRISKIVEFVDNRDLNSAQRALFTEAFGDPPPPEQVLVSLGTLLPGGGESGVAIASNTLDVYSPKQAESAPTLPHLERDGSVSWYLRINAGLLSASSPQRLSRSSETKPPPVGTDNHVSLKKSQAALPVCTVFDKTPRPALGKAQNVVDAAWESQPYYDVETEDAAKEEYYTDIDLNKGNEALFWDLHELLSSSHHTVFSYRRARLEHLYPLVDRRESCNLRNIYSGEILDPAEIIASEIEAWDQYVETLLARGLEFELENEDAIDELETTYSLEVNHPFNCEHVVPQSWFTRKKTPKTDLHHLFTCESECNSFRGNFAYFDFSPITEAIRADCGRRDGESGNNSKFEPEFGRGAVARATLYFLLRYPGEISGTREEMPLERIETLKRWHQAERVDRYELHRNATVFALQGSRNPLIDHPSWVDKIEFKKGFSS